MPEKLDTQINTPVQVAPVDTKVGIDTATDTKSTKDDRKTIVEAVNLNVSYNIGQENEAHVLKDINLKIKQGEYIIIFGPSGCGKSTLLFSMAGLQKATTGTVVVDDLVISDEEMDSAAMVNMHRHTISTIFQAFHLIPSLNVMRNVSLPAVFDDMSRMDRNKKVMNLLTRFGIAGQADKLPSQLSGGQKQRVAISRALVNDPKILFADEPVGNLDTKSAGVLLDILRDLNEKEKRTIVLVTHDPRHLVFADRVFYMNDGRIVKKVVNKSKGEMKEEAKDSTGIIASGGRHDKAWKERDEYEELVNKIAMSRKQLAIIERRMALAKYKGNDALEEMLKIEKIDETGELKLLTKSFSDISGLWRPSKFKEFKMKQLAQDLLLNINNVQFKLVKEYVANAVQANTSDGYNALFKMLDAPMKDGGAGLSKTKAIKIAKHTMDIVMAVNFITANDGADGGLRKNVEYLYKLFSTKYSIKDSNQSVLKSKEVIEFRLQNKIDGNDVLRLLDDSFKLGGAGLNRRNAKRIAKDLELILLMKYTPEKEMSTGIDKFGRARQTSFYKQGARVSGK